jgi:hemolysin activation/secretion protein
VEWIINAPGFADKTAFANRTWGEVFQVSLFYDYGNGKLNNPSQTEQEMLDDKTLQGAGGALQLNMPGKFYARLDVARRTTGLKPIGNDRDTQYWLTGRYEFSF